MPPSTSELDLLTGIHGTTLLAVVGGGTDPMRSARLLTPHFGPGPVVVSEPVAGARAGAPGRPLGAVRPARRLGLGRRARARSRPATCCPSGRSPATSRPRRALTALVHRALLADAVLYDTASTYLERTPSLEATARAMFIHPNTVRYRLRRIADVTGFSPTDARGAFTLRVGLVLGRLATDEVPD